MYQALARGGPQAARAAQGAGEHPQLGAALQVHPIKPTLKAPETKHLKLQHDEPLSSLLFISTWVQVDPIKPP